MSDFPLIENISRLSKIPNNDITNPKRIMRSSKSSKYLSSLNAELTDRLNIKNNDTNTREFDTSLNTIRYILSESKKANI